MRGKMFFTYLLLSTWLVMFVHGIIPHDHHYDVNCNHIHHKQQKISNAQPKAEHCFLFNDILISKPESGFSKKSSLPFHGTSMLFSNLIENTFFIGHHRPSNTLYTEFIVTQFGINQMPTRGSPLLV